MKQKKHGKKKKFEVSQKESDKRFRLAAGTLTIVIVVYLLFAGMPIYFSSNRYATAMEIWTETECFFTNIIYLIIGFYFRNKLPP